ncbi:Nematode cuticle collagen N-terminal domain containing protein [Aphelenchoides avenae]|nr:Nematode cuticle collagen N-terminal domain containing protein [Aphelenchus avenae]
MTDHHPTCRTEELLEEAQLMKKVAFIGVIVASVSALTAVICIPLLFLYAQNVQSVMREETAFCTMRTKGLYGEFEKYETLKKGPLAAAESRAKRQSDSSYHSYHFNGIRTIHQASYVSADYFRRYLRRQAHVATASDYGYGAVGVNPAFPGHAVNPLTLGINSAAFTGDGGKSDNTLASYAGDGGHVQQNSAIFPGNDGIGSGHPAQPTVHQHSGISSVSLPGSEDLPAPKNAVGHERTIPVSSGSRSGPASAVGSRTGPASSATAGASRASFTGNEDAAAKGDAGDNGQAGLDASGTLDNTKSAGTSDSKGSKASAKSAQASYTGNEDAADGGDAGDSGATIPPAASPPGQAPPSSVASGASGQGYGEAIPQAGGYESSGPVAGAGNAASPQPATSKQTCACQGPPGPPGLPGPDGPDGKDGPHGNEGPAGPDAECPHVEPVESCFQCPDAPAGPPGRAGSKGPPGPAGLKGGDAQLGTPGSQGPPGQPGPPGFTGHNGVPGEKGAPGHVADLPPAKGQPGPPGPPGPQGIPGQAGSPGKQQDNRVHQEGMEQTDSRVNRDQPAAKGIA